MGINEIRALKAAKTGLVMTAKEFNEKFKHAEVRGNPMAGKFRAGHFETSKGLVYFRSMWEANYALYLDFMISRGTLKDWQYEAETFFFDGIKMGTNCYKPDFKVFLRDGSIEYHEVKGYMDSKSKTKLKRMKKYHPKLRVVLIEKKEYNSLLKSMKGIIKFYT